MSYRAGIGQGIMGFGRETQPRIVCDGEGCGASHPVETAVGAPARWFLARKGPPMWRGDSAGGIDYCPECWGKLTLRALRGEP